jgi:hypothetical protein
MKNIVTNLFEIIRNFYINPNPELFQALCRCFFEPWFVYPPATPVDAMVIPRTSEKIIMPKLMIGCQGQWRAGPMNRIIFQPDGTRMNPIFHDSIVPIFRYNITEDEHGRTIKGKC